MLATLLRLFVPSWRFFDETTSGIRLRVRVITPASGAGPWIEVLTPPSRRVWHAVWNPEGNRTLAAYSLLERLLLDAADEDQRSLRTSLALVTELARGEATRLGLVAAGDTLEFAIVDAAPDAPEELVRSEAIAC